jgi:L-ascorbate metabolism protein UlaG (beta-lactamase superfamily)
LPGIVVLTYLHHSGFMAAVDKTLLVFDYWQGEDGSLPENMRVTDKDFIGFDKILVFVSHAHPDHFDQVIYTWNREDLPISYIVSDDMPIGTRGKRLKPGEKFTIAGVDIQAFDSTDLGVSYLVRINDINIFHAGDLNLWHWRGENTLRQITQAENAFYAAVQPIEKQKIDLCMFPVDPRMGGLFDAGAHHFIIAVKPRVFVPMHWHNRAEVALDFVRRAKGKHTDILALTKPRESAEITFTETEVTVRMLPRVPEIPAGEPISTGGAPAGPDVKLTAYSPEDPFSDTDLPIQIGGDPL